MAKRRRKAPRFDILKLSPEQEQVHLQRAMSKIRRVLEEFDLVGYVQLGGPVTGEYLLHLDPSWSVAKADGKEIRIRCKKEDFKGDKFAQRAALERTISAINALATMCQKHSNVFTEVVRMIGQQVDFHTHVRTTREGEVVDFPEEKDDPSCQACGGEGEDEFTPCPYQVSVHGRSDITCNCCTDCRNICSNEA